MAKKQLDSKTVKASIVIGALSIVEVNFHMLQELLGEWYGLSFMGFAVLMYALRLVTKEPLA